MQIAFIDNDTGIKLKSKRILKRALEEYFGSMLTGMTKINIVFFTDEALLSLNKAFLGHDTFTDVITFYDKDNENLLGDICISIDRVAENAERFGQDRNTELKRVIIHGFLHLAGYSDKKPRDTKSMKAAEDKALKYFVNIKTW